MRSAPQTTSDSSGITTGKCACSRPARYAFPLPRFSPKPPVILSAAASASERKSKNPYSQHIRRRPFHKRRPIPLESPRESAPVPRLLGMRSLCPRFSPKPGTPVILSAAASASERKSKNPYSQHVGRSSFHNPRSGSSSSDIHGRPQWSGSHGFFRYGSAEMNLDRVNPTF